MEVLADSNAKPKESVRDWSFFSSSLHVHHGHQGIADENKR